MTALLADAGPFRPGPWILLVPLVWTAAALLTVLVLRATALRGRRGGEHSGCALGSRLAADAPVAVLGRRYAEGDIDAAEYRARLAVLTGQTAAADLLKSPRDGA